MVKKEGWMSNSSPLVWLFVLLVLMMLSSYLGVFVVWAGVAGAFFIFGQHSIRAARLDTISSILDIHSPEKEIRSEESQWVNNILHKYWKTCDKQIESYSPMIVNALNHNQATSLGSAKFRVQGFQLGSRAPIIERIETHSFLPDNQVQLDVHFYFCPDRIFQLAVAPVPFVPPLVGKVSQFVMRGTARIVISWNSVYPSLSEFSFGLLGTPKTDFKLSFLGQMDVMALPGVYQWVNESVENMLREITWPNFIVFRLPNHAAFLPLLEQKNLADHDKPIVEIGLVHAGDILPEGWELVHRSVSGVYAADLNRRTNAPEIYLAFKRQQNEEEESGIISSLCVIFPEKGETPPPSFFELSHTLANQDANLGNANNPCFICVSRATEGEMKGARLIDLQVFNKTMEGPRCPKFWTVLEFSPDGHRANLNKGHSDADEIYLAFAGCQNRSPFGYVPKVKPEKGLLRVTLHSAINLKGIEASAICDTYADIFITHGSTGEKTASKVNQTAAAEKTSNPKWEQTAIFKATSSDLLNIVLYNITATRDDVIGILKFPLDTLQVASPVTSWYELQAASQGHVLLTIEAINFGLSQSCQKGRPLHQIDIGKSGRKVRKFRIAEKPLRPTISSKSSQVVSSLRISGQKKHQDITEVSDNATNASLEDQVESSEGNEDGEGNRYVGKRGYLEKAITSSYKKAKQSRRWFVLKDDCLAMFKTPKEKNSIETISLKDAKVILDENHFTLRNTRHKWDLFAASPTEAEDWTYCIRKNISLFAEGISNVNEEPQSPVMRASGNMPIHRRTDSTPDNLSLPSN